MTNAVVSHEPFVCPLCPLHCDDVRVGDAGRWQASGCPIAEGFSPEQDSTVTGPCSRGDVLEILPSLTVDPLPVVTAGVDLVTARALARWQQDGHVQLAVESDASIAAVTSVVSRDGGVGCTLAAMFDRADWVWTIGAVDKAWPRFATRGRRDALTGRGGHWHSSRQMTAQQLADWSGRCRIGDRTDPIAATWLESRYGVVVVGPQAFPDEEAEPAVAILGRTIRQRNESSRAAWLTLDPAVTVKSVWAWQFNQTPSTATIRTHWTAPMPVVRLGTPLSQDAPKVRLQIGGRDPGKSQAEVFCSAAAAGWHHASMTIRGDGSVSLPLSQMVGGGPPTIAERMEALLLDRPSPLVQRSN